MKVLLDLVARHRQGQALGLTSICCAHPIVIEASLRHALKHGDGLVLRGLSALPVHLGPSGRPAAAAHGSSRSSG